MDEMVNSNMNDIILEKTKELDKVKAKNNKIKVENSILKDKNAIQDAEIALLKSQLRDMKKKAKELSDKAIQAEAEANLYKQWVYDMEHSTAWKITKPFRTTIDKLKRR